MQRALLFHPSLQSNTTCLHVLVAFLASATAGTPQACTPSVGMANAGTLSILQWNIQGLLGRHSLPVHDLNAILVEHRPALVFIGETHLFTYQHRSSLQEVRHILAHLGYTLFLNSVDADGPGPTALSRRQPLAMAPGGVLLAVRTPLASHPLARLRDVPTQLAGYYCLHHELPMVTNLARVFCLFPARWDAK